MIHPTAEVYTKKIGQGSQIWQFSVVLEGAQIGCNCNINSHVFIENDVIIGDEVTVKAGVQLWDGLRVASGVFIGPNATFINDHIPRSKKYLARFMKTIIEEGASIGANATILGGLYIAHHSLIGAGSVLTSDTEPFSVWFGNPARLMGFIASDSTLLDLHMRSKKDGRLYHIVGKKLIPKDD